MRRRYPAGLLNRLHYDENGCWNYTGPLSVKGYGKASHLGKFVTAHRLAMHLWRQFDLASPLHVLHRCDNPSCFNPKHLFLGDNSANQQDALAKGRHAQAAKTHCRNGHPYTPENTRVRFCKGSWMRECMICVRHNGRIADRKRYHTRKRGKLWAPGRDLLTDKQ